MFQQDHTTDVPTSTARVCLLVPTGYEDSVFGLHASNGGSGSSTLTVTIKNASGTVVTTFAMTRDSGAAENGIVGRDTPLYLPAGYSIEALANASGWNLWLNSDRYAEGTLRGLLGAENSVPTAQNEVILTAPADAESLVYSVLARNGYGSDISAILRVLDASDTVLFSVGFDLPAAAASVRLVSRERPLALAAGQKLAIQVDYPSVSIAASAQWTSLV